MRELLHLMAKDWLYIRLWAFVCWGLTIAAWLALDMAGHPHLRHVSGVVHLIALLLPFVAVVRLFQLDPVLDSTAFWPTRPLGRTHVLAAKLAVAWGAVLGPCLLLSVAPLALRGMGLTARDYVLAVAAMLVRYLLIGWFALLVAGVARNLGAAALVAAALAVAIAVVTHLSEIAFTSTAPDDASFVVALSVLLPAQALVYLHVLYRTKRLGYAAAVVALSGVAILALRSEWRSSWSGSWMAVVAPPAAPRSVGTRTHWPIRVEFLERRGQVLSWQRGWGEGQRATAGVRIHGLEPGMSLRQLGSETRLDDVSGVRRWDDYDIDWHVEGIPVGGWMPRPAAVLGCISGSGVTGSVQVVSLPGTGDSWRTSWDRLSRLERIVGSLKFSVVRWSVRERVPVDGGTLRFPGGRFVAARPRIAGGGTAIVLRQERLSLLPFPSPRESHRPVLFYPATADCLALQDTSRLGGATMTLPVGVEAEAAERWSRLGRSEQATTEPIPQATEMLFLDHEVLGTLEVPFDFPGPAKAKAALQRSVQ
jgi:hypothetical protein